MKYYLKHVSTALFAGLLAGNPWIALTYLAPFADKLLKYYFGYDVLHTIWGTVVMVLLYNANLPYITLTLAASHAAHLLLDIITPEGLTPLAPLSKKKIIYAVPYSEHAITIISITGSVVLLIGRVF